MPLPLLNAWTGLALVLLYWVEHDLGRVRGRVALVPLAPVITNGVGKDAAGLVERCRGDAAADVGVTLETVLGVLVPEVEGAVATGCAEGAVLGVEGDVVDSVDGRGVALGGVAVALEREVGAGKRSRLVGVFGRCASKWGGEDVRRILVLHILNGASTLDRADSKALGIVEAADHTSLPFKRTLHCLVELAGVLQVDHVDIAISGSDHEQVVAHIHGIDALLGLHRGGRVRGAEIPVLDLLVPATCHRHGRAIGLEVANALDGHIVSSDLHRLTGGQIENLGGLVGAGGDDLCAVLLGEVHVSVLSGCLPG